MTPRTTLQLWRIRYRDPRTDEYVTDVVCVPQGLQARDVRLAYLSTLNRDELPPFRVHLDNIYAEPGALI